MSENDLSVQILRTLNEFIVEFREFKKEIKKKLNLNLYLQN